MKHKILILSNMGPSKEKPLSGGFVNNQYLMLKSMLSCELDYFYLHQSNQRGIGRGLRYPWFFIQFIFRYVFSTKPVNIIHVHFYYPLILFALVYKFCRNWNVRIVVTFHGSDIYAYEHPSKLYRWCSTQVDKFIFVSQQLKERFFEKVDAEVISAGILEQYFDQTTETEKNYDFIFVGHLDENKGIGRIRELIKQDLSLSLLIVSPDMASDEVEQALTNSKVQVTLKYGQSPEQLKSLYQQSRFYLSLSKKESFGLVMTEAMACGLPVIASKTDGSLTQVNESKNGFLLKNEESWMKDNLGGKLLVVSNMSKRDYLSMSANAKKTAKLNRLTLVCHQIENIYTKLFKEIESNV